MNERSASEPRILKIGVCDSLSSRTSITYHVAVREKDDICFRIWKTSGKGVFSKEWVCASTIQAVLGQNEAISASTLLPVFVFGHSVNTAGFLLAVLKHEGLVTQASDAHKYVRVQSEKFVTDMAALIKSGGSLDPAADAPTADKPGKKGKRKAAVPPWEAPADAATE